MLKAKIWDTAGQEIYRSLNKKFYKEARGGIIVADLSIVNKKANLEYWYNEFKEQSDKDSQVVLVGNKADLEKDEDTLALLKQFAQDKKIPYYEVSAWTGMNVDVVMKELMQIIAEKYYKDNRESASSPLFPKRNLCDAGQSIRLSETKTHNEDSSSSCCSKNN